MRKNYEQGVDNYYKQVHNSYRNPHFYGITKTLNKFLSTFPKPSSIVDLSCGRYVLTSVECLLSNNSSSGEATEIITNFYKRRNEESPSIIATDPFTMSAYTQRTGRTCLPLSFQDIAQGKLEGEFELVIISFALHLISDNSALYSFLTQLSYQSKYLCILSPHKKPEIKQSWGFERLNPLTLEVDQSDNEELYIERVRLRLFKSYNYFS